MTKKALTDPMSPSSSSRKRGRDALEGGGPRLEQRSCSYCIQRMLRYALRCRKEEVVQEEEKKKKPARPLNSYLKIVLDNETMDKLHEISVRLGKEIQNMPSQQQMDGDDGNVETDSTKKKGNARPLKFRSRSRNSLHFTFFFGGEVICSMSPEELMCWHGNVKDRLAKSGFLLESSSDPLATAQQQSELEAEESQSDGRDNDEMDHNNDGEYWFRIKELSLFPPRRNYLIVVLFEASPAWHALYNDIRNIAINGNCEALKALAERDKGGEWIPHITLGNLYGGRKNRALNELRRLLQNFEFETRASPADSQANNDVDNCRDSIQATSITMGGPLPQQAELDWKFHKSEVTQRPA